MFICLPSLKKEFENLSFIVFPGERGKSVFLRPMRWDGGKVVLFPLPDKVSFLIPLAAMLHPSVNTIQCNFFFVHCSGFHCLPNSIQK